MKYIFSSSLIWIILLIVHTIYIWLIKLENASFNTLLLLFKTEYIFFESIFLRYPCNAIFNWQIQD
jgi:hypothetical protein